MFSDAQAIVPCTLRQPPPVCTCSFRPVFGLHVSMGDGALEAHHLLASPPPLPILVEQGSASNRAAVADEDIAELNLGEKKKKKKKKVVLEVAVRSRRAAHNCTHSENPLSMAQLARHACLECRPVSERLSIRQTASITRVGGSRSNMNAVLWSQTAACVAPLLACAAPSLAADTGGMYVQSDHGLTHRTRSHRTMAMLRWRTARQRGTRPSWDSTSTRPRRRKRRRHAPLPTEMLLCALHPAALST